MSYDFNGETDWSCSIYDNRGRSVTTPKEDQKRKEDGSVAANVIAAIEMALGDENQRKSNESPIFVSGASKSNDDTSNA